MHSADSTEIADEVYFAAIQKQFIKELQKGMHSVSYVRRELELLTTDKLGQSDEA